jgi:hypothetical protein
MTTNPGFGLRPVSSAVVITTVDTYVLVKREICQRDQRYSPYALERVPPLIPLHSFALAQRLFLVGKQVAVQ